MNRLKEKYQQEVVQTLKKEFNHDNVFAVGKIQKVVLNMGIKDPADPKARLKVIENIADQFTVIAGQKPQITRARQSIANFKLREGDPLGVAVTLRGQRMWEFLDKLISIALPRVKDFRGISRVAFDGQGNYSLGVEEQIVFPEIEYDKIESIRSLQINIVTSTKNDQESFRMLELLGFPFEKEEDKK
ncbi:MAG: 50S ribosomal protein L5 [Patescibacteria group bacterium]